MKCFFFHKWGKWKRYIAVTRKPIFQKESDTFSFCTIQGIDDPKMLFQESRNPRQERICERCGLIQDREVAV